MTSWTAIFLAFTAIGYSALGQNLNTNQQGHQATQDDSDMYMEPLDAQPEQSQQNSFYPSFPPFQDQPLGHSRPFYYGNQPEGAYSQRPQSPYNQQLTYDTPRYNSFNKGEPFQGSSSTSESSSVGILGSGNFGVIRGGTFYNDNDGKSASSTDDDFNNYFHNGHGRPSSFYGFGGSRGNPRPYQHEQFANFRDFADINTPNDRQYSHYVVVYVNKNGTKQEPQEKPKNIIESLALLDQTEPAEGEVAPQKKLSKSKRKLAKLLPEKKYKIKNFNSFKDLHEPLLALS